MKGIKKTISGLLILCVLVSMLPVSVFAETAEPVNTPGDIDGNRILDTDDVIQLLLHISLPDLFPLELDVEFSGDGELTSDDVVQLLLHISLPELFPLHVGKTKEGRLYLEKKGQLLSINIPSGQGNDLYLQFGFVLDVNQAINLNQYRLKSMYLVDADYARVHTLKSVTEIEGVIQEVGSSDFIGGYHGDESFEFCTVLADGTEKPMDGDDYTMYCDTLDIMVKSTVNAMDNAQDKVFTRYKHLVFSGNTLTIENDWTALRSVNIGFGYMTMMSLPITSNGAYVCQYCKDNVNGVVQEILGERLENGPFTFTNGVSCIEQWSGILSVKSEGEINFAGNKSLIGFVSTQQFNTAKAYFLFRGYMRGGQKITGKSVHTFAF